MIDFIGAHILFFIGMMAMVSLGFMGLLAFLIWKELYSRAPTSGLVSVSR
jgi:hypothetical protein